MGKSAQQVRDRSSYLIWHQLTKENLQCTELCLISEINFTYRASLLGFLKAPCASSQGFQLQQAVANKSIAINQHYKHKVQPFQMDPWLWGDHTYVQIHISQSLCYHGSDFQDVFQCKNLIYGPEGHSMLPTSLLNGLQGKSSHISLAAKITSWIPKSYTVFFQQFTKH